MTETTIKKLEPKRIREFIGGGDLVKIEVLDQIEFQDTDEGAWKKDDDGIWRCHPIEGKRCDSGTKCKGVTVTVEKDGVKKTVSWCMCA